MGHRHRPHAARRVGAVAAPDPDPRRRGGRAGGTATARRAALHDAAARLERQGTRAIVERARALARLSRAPADHVERHRRRLHQQTRELRPPAAARSPAASGRRTREPPALARKATAAAAAARGRRDLDRLALALAAHDPQRTLERGYALVEDEAGEPVTSAAATDPSAPLTLRFHDGRVRYEAGGPTRGSAGPS